MRLVIIRPVGFRLRKGARLAYTQPAYLICTDPELPLQDILEEYVWRWDIELNHRDEKTILGVGQARVRNPNSAQSVPAMAVAAYSGGGSVPWLPGFLPAFGPTAVNSPSP